MTSPLAPAPRTKRPPLGPTDTITLSSDPPDDHTPAAPKSKRLRLGAAAPPSTSDKANAENVGLSALADRAQLERERVARQRALQAAAGPSTGLSTIRGVGTARRVAEGSFAKETSLGAAQPSDPETAVGEAGDRTGGGVGSSLNSRERFWAGALRKVPNIYNPCSTDLSLADLIGPRGRPDLVKALVCTYKSEVAWIASHFAHDTDLTLVLPARDRNPPCRLPPAYHPTTTVVYPPVDGEHGGVMHVKLLVLACQTYCRVVVMTANLYQFDWTECDNALYVHDFPPAAATAPSPSSNPTHTAFSRPILSLLTAMGVPAHSLAPFGRYNLLSSAAVRSVVTRQGKFYGWDKMEAAGGLVGLAKVVKQLGAGAGGKWTVEASGSSIGPMPPNWQGAMYAACAGVSLKEWGFAEKQKQPADRAFRLTKVAQAKANDDEPFRFIFPSERQIMSSVRGAGLGGSYWCKAKTWAAATFPRHLFHRAENKRGRVPQHTKAMIGLHRPAECGGKLKGWMLLGSHNPTQAAWGKLQFPKGRTQPQMVCPNWELSVVFGFEAASEEELEARADELAFYERPVAKYGVDVAWQKGQLAFGDEGVAAVAAALAD